MVQVIPMTISLVSAVLAILCIRYVGVIDSHAGNGLIGFFAVFGTANAIWTGLKRPTIPGDFCSSSFNAFVWLAYALLLTSRSQGDWSFIGYAALNLFVACGVIFIPLAAEKFNNR